MSSFWRGLAIQWRVLGALLIREIYSRFGRESLGFAWIVAEPLVFALPVLFVWRAVRDPTSMGFRSCHFCGAAISRYCCSVISAAVYYFLYGPTCRCSTINGSRSLTFLSHARCW